MSPRARKPERDDENDVVEGVPITDEQIELTRRDGDPPPRASRAELTKRVGEEGELSGLDARLLQMAAAGKSPQEMGEDTGMSAARAAQRVREILASRDWLSNLEREILFMQEMIDLKVQIQDLVKRYSEANFLHGMDPRWATTLQKILSDLMKVIDVRSKRVAEQRVTIRSAHAKLVTAVIEKAFKLLVHELRERNQEVDEMVYRDALEEALPRAFEMLAEHTETV